MRLLDLHLVRFSRSDGGFISMDDGCGTVIGNVECLPLFPRTDPHSYISIQRKKDKDYEEVGVIRAIGEMTTDQRELVAGDIAFRYFLPEITDVVKIKGARGKDRWEVTTDRGERVFEVEDRNENVVLSERGMVTITDTAGCRYQIGDYRKLSGRARVLLERMLL